MIEDGQLVMGVTEVSVIGVQEFRLLCFSILISYPCSVIMGGAEEDQGTAWL
jgi:hypothetical protein